MHPVCNGVGWLCILFSVLIFHAKLVTACQEGLHNDGECLSKTAEDPMDSEEGCLLQLPLEHRLVVSRSAQRSAPAVDMWQLYTPDHFASHLKAEVLAAYKTTAMAVHATPLTRQVTAQTSSPIDWRKVGLLALGLTFLALAGRLVFWAFVDERVASAEVMLKAKVAEPLVCKDVPEDQEMSFQGIQDRMDNDAIVKKLREQSESMPGIRKKLKPPSRKRELSDPWSKVDNISDDNDRHFGGARSPLLTSETSSVETAEGPSTGASSDSSSAGSVQFLVLPFRLCGGRALVFVLHLFAPIMSCLTFVFLTANNYEPCYGRETDCFDTFDDFLQACGAIRRKNIKRNYNAAAKIIQKRGIEATFHRAGTWHITSELRELLWHQCLRHVERARGYADINNCQQPISPCLMMVGEMVLLLAFPCDIQLFRNKSGDLISINTRVHTGNVYFNPNYATLEEHSRDGIYAYANWDIMHEAIKLRVSFANLMPCMRVAKKALGQRPLRLGPLLLSSVSFSRLPRLPSQEEQRPAVPAKEPMSGGKRAARKRASAAAAALAMPTQE